MLSGAERIETMSNDSFACENHHENVFLFLSLSYLKKMPGIISYVSQVL
jgi:hypothetical protein